uniref:Uncharacterized protein n=1 Tax=Oryza sativa subsp. japonica TaxID=39947 RepID=Q6YZN8_ORYSJ|nr:hypothetical protein [Oryza sativa Japonica Group]BAD03746.1 hypothetical protein [Oryza sativa Japonica Group]
MTATTTGGIPAAGEDGCGEDRSAPAAARMCTATTATGDGDDGDLDRSGDDGDHEGNRSEGRRLPPGRTGAGRTDPPGRRRGCARRPRRKRRRHALPSPPLPSPRSVRGEEAVAGEDGRGEDGSARPAVRMCTATTATGDGDNGDHNGSGDDGDHEGSGGAAPSHPLLSPLPYLSDGRRPPLGRTGAGRTDPPRRRLEEHGSAPAVARGARPRGLDLVTTDAVGPRAVVLGFL